MYPAIFKNIDITFNHPAIFNNINVTFTLKETCNNFPIANVVYILTNATLHFCI